MALTQAETEELAGLKAKYGLFPTATEPAPEQTGFLGFTGQTLANIPSSALEKVVQPMQAIMGGGRQDVEYSQIPRIFDTRTPQGIGEHLVAGGAELASYLPAIAMSEGLGIAGLQGLGASATAAKIGGSALGFGLSMAPQGAETAAVQGGVGALQTAAQDFGWKGKLAAGLLGGAAGYYEGAKGPEGTPLQGVVYGALNLLGPTLIDPALAHITGANKAAAAIAKETTPATLPNQSRGPIPFSVSPDGPKDVSVFKLGTSPIPENNPGLPFYQVPTPLDIGGGRPIVGQSGGIRPPMVEGLNARQMEIPSDLTEAPSPTASYYGRGTQPFNVFSGVLRPQQSVQTYHGLFEEPITPVGAYGRQLDIPDIFTGLQQRPNLSALSPEETAAKIKFDSTRPAPEPTPIAPIAHPQNKLASGLLNKLETAPGWTAAGQPMGQSFTKDAFNFGASMKTVEDVKRAHVGAKKLEAAGMKLLESENPNDFMQAQELINKAQYLREAAEYAEGTPGKVEFFKKYHDPAYQPSVPGKEYLAAQQHHPVVGAALRLANGETMLGKAEENHMMLAARATSDLHPEEAGSFYTTKPGEILSREDAGARMKHKGTLRAEDIGGPPPKTEPVKPATAPAVREKVIAAAVRTSDGKIWTGTSHPDAFDTAVAKNPKYAFESPDADLFKTDQGRIITRDEAFKLSHKEDLVPTHEAITSIGSLDYPWGKEVGPWNFQKIREEGLPTPVKAEQVRIKGKFGMETASVVGREGDTLHVEIDDPIFGKRQASVLTSETHPMPTEVALLQKPTFKGIEDPLPYWTEEGGWQQGEDFKIETSLWKQISPTGNTGGTLSAIEAARRLKQLGHTEVEGKWLSGDSKGKTFKMKDLLKEGTVPFKDVPGARTMLDRADERFGGEGGMLSSVMEGSGPTAIRRTLKGRDKLTLTLEEGLKKLPLEAATIIKQVVTRLQEATGQKLDISLAQKMIGAKGGMYEKSGKIALNLQWINGVAQNWSKLSADGRGAALMRVAALLGHEITHVAQKFGERSNLMIDGVPLTKIIMEKVDGLSLPQRKYVIEQIMKAKGDPSKLVSNYLAGDIDAVYGWYKRLRPNLTREAAKELAAGEFMAEIGATELVQRMKVDGLPPLMRSAINKFKEVLGRVVAWFKNEKFDENLAALQGLKSIAGKMYDHLATADEAALHAAFPANDIWRPSEAPNPFLSGKSPVPIEPSLITSPFVKTELLRLGVRSLVGAGIGGAVGPILSDHHMSFAESAIAGGVMGAFGPMMIRAIASTQATKELVEAARIAKGGSFAQLKTLMQGDTLRNLGAEARYGWRGDGSFVAKVVRSLESEMKVNFDPKLKAVYEQARGIMGYRLAMIEKALKDTRWVKPSEGVRAATTEFIEGRLSTEQFRNLLTDDGSKLYGELMITAREATSIGTDNIAAGMRKSALRDAIVKNNESYVGRFYKAYRKGEFDMAYFDKVKADIMTMNPGLDIHNADALLREHMVEIKANRELFSRKRGTGAQALDSKIRFARRATEEEIYMQQLEVAHHEHNQYGAEYKAAKAKLDWMETHKITDNWRGWLGEIKDPTERMLYTFQKIYPRSIAGKVFDLLDNGLDSFGNKWAYSSKELSNTRTSLASEIAAGGDVAALQKRLSELEAFTPLPEGASYGKLSGKFTNRFVRDEISTYDTPYKWMDQPVLRTISSINNLVKVNRTVLNPATMLRNYMQMPLFMLMARVSPQEIWHAAQVIHKDANPALLKLMYEKHILGVDYAAQELTTNLGHLVSGYFDSDTAVKVARQGYDFMHKTYQQPDMLLRAGAFISAQKRMAERLNLPLNHSSVIDAAVEAADRVTMNYATVPRAVKALRQLPFVSLFISYTSEITKIIKNLSMDAINYGGKTHIQDRMHAITVLGAMAAVPALLTAGFESNLSPTDQKDWAKVRALQPDYARSRFYLPLSREKDGRFRYMDITAMIPADNYTQMMKSALAGDTVSALKANPIFALQDTPLLNVATEQISGKDLQTGQPVEGLGRVQEILKEILPPIIPPGFEGERMIRAFSQNAQGTLGLTNLKTGVQTRPSDVIAGYLTGIRFANVQLSTVQRSAMSDATQEISQEKQHMNETVRMNVSDEQRREAMNRYTESVKQILFQLHQRMGQSPSFQ